LILAATQAMQELAGARGAAVGKRRQKPPQQDPDQKSRGGQQNEERKSERILEL
jgi:hypothetical protein